LVKVNNLENDVKEFLIFFNTGKNWAVQMNTGLNGIKRCIRNFAAGIEVAAPVGKTRCEAGRGRRLE